MILLPSSFLIISEPTETKIVLQMKRNEKSISLAIARSNASVEETKAIAFEDNCNFFLFYYAKVNTGFSLAV